MIPIFWHFHCVNKARRVIARIRISPVSLPLLLWVLTVSGAGFSMADAHRADDFIRFRIPVKEPGLYSVTCRIIAQKLEIDMSAAKGMLESGRTHMTCQGRIVKFLKRDGTIYFLGVGIDSIYTDTNIYWLNLDASFEKGDVNGDGLVNVEDSLSLLRVLSGDTGSGIRDDFAQSGADVDGDGIAGMQDLAEIADTIMAAEDHLMPEIMTPATALPPGDPFFYCRRIFESDRWDQTDIFFDPEDDYWLWEIIIPGDPDFGSCDFAIYADEIYKQADGVLLTVNLKGAIDSPGSPDHHARIIINGVELEEAFFDGLELKRIKCAVPEGVLVEGENRVTITGIPDPDNFSYFSVDSIELLYPRKYRAKNDSLFFSSSGKQIITIEGFHNSSTVVLDISDPFSPVLITGYEILQNQDEYSVLFPCAGSEPLSYLAVSLESAVSPAEIFFQQDSGAGFSGNAGCDYLIICPGEFREAAEALAVYRRQTGLEPLVVTLEQVYDTFSYGICKPEAIRTAVGWALRNMDPAPSYLVLIGDGTYDYRNLTNAGDNLVPVMMTATPYGLFSSDWLYVDTDSDGIPEIPVGRIPVDTPSALLAYIDKLKAYEAHQWTGQELGIGIVADIPDPQAGDFHSDADNLSLLVPQPFRVIKIYLNSMEEIGSRRNELLSLVDSGVWLIDYIGHGTYDRWAAGSGLLSTSDLDSMTNNLYPVMVAMTCSSGWFSVPGLDSLSEVMVTAPGKGFIAAWSPTGLSLNREAVSMNHELFLQIFAQQQARLGDFFLEVVHFYHDSGGPDFMQWIYNLLGDPALMVSWQRD